MMLVRIATWLGIAGALAYVVTEPGRSANAVRSIAGGIGDFLTGLFT